jgi:hypothetical protein
LNWHLSLRAIGIANPHDSCIGRVLCRSLRQQIGDQCPTLLLSLCGIQWLGLAQTGFGLTQGSHGQEKQRQAPERYWSQIRIPKPEICTKLEK